MIPEEVRADIRRLYYAERWKVGTIAAFHGVHHKTVRLVIESGRMGAVKPRPHRASRLDPYVGFVRDTLGRYPRLRSTRLFQMIVERGYTGSVVQLRRLVVKLRPKPLEEAYLRLTVLPGEQAQVDWACFGTVRVGNCPRALSCFVMVLSWSRALNVLFTLDQSMESFLKGHVQSFEFFGGVPRTLLYDNLKSVVLERWGDAVRFHPRLLELAGHYHFAPRPCGVRRANEKGRVERTIGYLRSSFFAARPFRDIDDLNAQFRVWREEVAHKRMVPGRKDLTVAQALLEERSRLLTLPEHPFETDRVAGVASGKTPYVRFDRNFYSIPHEYLGKPLTLVAGDKLIRILDGEKEIAGHSRSYDSGATIEDPAHVAALVAFKRKATQTKGRDRLAACVPRIQELFEALAQKGEALHHHTSRFNQLLDDYGPEEMKGAVEEAMNRQAYGSASVAHILEVRRRAKGLKPPVRVQLPDNPKVRELRVTPHNLEDYDALANSDPDKPKPR